MLWKRRPIWAVRGQHHMKPKNDLFLYEAMYLRIALLYEVLLCGLHFNLRDRERIKGVITTWQTLGNHDFFFK